MEQKKFYQVKREHCLQVWNPEIGKYEDVPGARGNFYNSRGNCLVIGKNWSDCKRFVVDSENQKLWQLAEGNKDYEIYDDYAFFRKGWDWYIQLVGSDKVTKLFRFGDTFNHSGVIKSLGGRKKMILNIHLKQKDCFAVFDMQDKKLEYQKEVTDSEDNRYRVKDKWYRYLGPGQADELLGVRYAEYGGFFAFFADGDYHIRFEDNMNHIITCKEFEIWNRYCLLLLREDGLYDIYDEGRKLHCSGENDWHHRYWYVIYNDGISVRKFRWNFDKSGYESVYDGPDENEFDNAVTIPLGDDRVRLLNLDEGGKIVYEGTRKYFSRFSLQIDDQCWDDFVEDYNCYLDWDSRETVRVEPQAAVSDSENHRAEPVKDEEKKSSSGSWRVIINWLKNFWK